MKLIDRAKLTAADRKTIRGKLSPLPNLPTATAGASQARRYAVIVEEVRNDGGKENATGTGNLKEALIRIAQAIEANVNAADSVFRIAVTEDDWAKLVSNRARHRKSGEGQHDPVNITLRIARP